MWRTGSKAIDRRFNEAYQGRMSLTKGVSNMSRMVATTIETVDGCTRMVYHGTCVAKYKQKLWNANDPNRAPLGKTDYKVVLNTGGYSTVTTKKRMNQFAKMFDLGFSVYQKDGDWFVCRLHDGGDVDDKYCRIKFNGNTCEFTIER